MFDKIERVRQSFITRKTEQTASEQYIHHSDIALTKHQNHDHKDNWKDHDDDLTDISVESLIIFLEGLKKEQSSKINPDNPQKPVNPIMSNALNAYGSHQQKTEKRFTYIDNDDQTIDIHYVDFLIGLLKNILADNIHHITLLPADTFLKSIEITIEKLSSL